MTYKPMFNNRQKIADHYNPEHDMIVIDGEVLRVTWAEYELLHYCRELENRIAELEKKLAG